MASFQGLMGADHASQKVFDLFGLVPVESLKRPPRITVFGGRRLLKKKRTSTNDQFTK